MVSMHRNHYQIKALEADGIDANKIVEGSLNSAGYDIFLTQDEGEAQKRVYEYGILAVEFVPWTYPEQYILWKKAQDLDRRREDGWLDEEGING